MYLGLYLPFDTGRRESEQHIKEKWAIYWEGGNANLLQQGGKQRNFFGAIASLVYVLKEALKARPCLPFYYQPCHIKLSNISQKAKAV